MRFSTPCSRRKTRFMASALKVVDMTARPAMPGTMTSRSDWLELKIAPKSARNSSGRAKLKNAADGLRQNRRRSRRYWRQARPTASATGALRLLGVGGELEGDVLEGRARDREVAQRGAARQGAARELVQQRRGVRDLALLEEPPLVAPGDAVARRARAERGGRAHLEDAALLDDRHAVAERLRLVEVVRRQQHRLAQSLQRADGAPRGPPRGRVEARRRLVEEDELGVADEREGEVQPAQLAAGQRPRQRVLLALQACDVEHLVDVPGARVEAGPVGDGLAHADVAVHARGLQDDADPLAEGARALLGVVAEDRHDAARAAPVALEHLDGRRLAGAVGAEEPEDLAAGDLEVHAAHRLVAAVGLAQL